MRSTDALWPPPGPRSVVVALRDAPSSAAREELCRRVRRLLLRADVDVVTCDLRDAGDPDLTTVDALARLRLTARRLGGDLRLRAITDDVRRLLALAGLEDVLATPGSAADRSA